MIFKKSLQWYFFHKRCYHLDSQRLTNPNDDTSTREQPQHLNFEKESEKDTGIKEKTYVE